MLKKTITTGEALIAHNVLSMLSQRAELDYMFRPRAGLNAQALQPVVAPIQAERKILERQFSQPPKPTDPKEAEAWKPWTPEEVATAARAVEVAWQVQMAEPVEVAVPGLRWADLEAQDKKLTIGGDVVAALLFLLTDAPGWVHEMLADMGG